MIPLVATNAAIADELPGAVAWATRRQIVMDTRSIPVRTLRLVLVQPDSNENFYLQATFEDYRAHPPLWQWYDESWSSTDALHLSPQPGTRPAALGGSMFIQHNGQGPHMCAVQSTGIWRLTKARIRIGAASLNG